MIPGASEPSFSDLRHVRLSSYLDRCRHRGGFLFFHHIPKTAGSSTVQELARFGGHCSIYNHHEKLKAGLFREVFEPQVRETITGARAGRYRSASGHLRAEFVRTLRSELPGLRVVTVVREPVSRYLSDYYFQRDSAHPYSAEFRERHPTLASMVAEPSTHNKMVDYLFGLSGFDADPARYGAIVESILGSHMLIGLFEAYPMFVSVLWEIRGQSGRTPAFHMNLRAKTEDDTRIDRRLLSEIRDRNRLDAALYDAVQSIWRKRHAEWFELRRLPSETSTRT